MRASRIMRLQLLFGEVLIEVEFRESEWKTGIGKPQYSCRSCSINSKFQEHR